MLTGHAEIARFLSSGFPSSNAAIDCAGITSLCSLVGNRTQDIGTNINTLATAITMSHETKAGYLVGLPSRVKCNLLG